MSATKKIDYNLLIRRFIYKLLGRRKRRFVIMYKWNIRQPVKGDSMLDIISRLFTIILHKPISLEMTQDGIMLWENEPGLLIPYQWMTQRERHDIVVLHLHRNKIFDQPDSANDQEFHFKRCKYRPRKLGEWLSLNSRKEMVRDFVNLCYMQKEGRLSLLRHSLMKWTQNHLVNGKSSTTSLRICESLNCLTNNQCGVDLILIQ